MTSNKTIPLGPVNATSLKVKENQTRTVQLVQPKELTFIGPQFPEGKTFRKKSAPPPVPKFEEKPSQISELTTQETLNKFLSEFKEENSERSIIIEEPIEKINERSDIIEESIEKIDIKVPEPISQKDKTYLTVIEKENNPQTQSIIEPIPEKNVKIEQIHINKSIPQINSNIPEKKTEPPVFQKPDFKLNLDLISNMYKQQINQNTKKEAPKKNTENLVSNEKVLIPLMKKEIRPTIEEYDPTKPNDYETLIGERLERERKLKELEKKNKMEIEEPKINTEMLKMKPSPKKEMPQIVEKEKEFTNEEKIIKMMEKSGWKFGQGLGKNEQGMTTPLITKKTTSNTAIIVNSTVEMSSVLPQDLVLKKRLEVQNIQPTRVLLLKNMARKDSVDEGLKEEVAEECERYGKVLSCVIHMMKEGMNEEDEVRIFVEFDKKESCMKAYASINGRFFAGRTVIARFYDEKTFANRRYDN